MVWISFEEFYNPSSHIFCLVEKSKKVKKKMKDRSDNSNNGDLNAQQLSIKLIINTLYGVFAEQYF